MSPAVCRAYQNLYARGTLLLRVNLMPNWHGFSLHQETEVLHRLVEEMGVYTGFGDQWLRLGPLKLVFDGGLTSRTAWLSLALRGRSGPAGVGPAEAGPGAVGWLGKDGPRPRVERGHSRGRGQLPGPGRGCHVPGA
ncbi:MAG: hypothetical protein AB1445_13960 [Bacillota bacterium]